MQNVDVIPSILAWKQLFVSNTIMAVNEDYDDGVIRSRVLWPDNRRRASETVLH